MPEEAMNPNPPVADADTPPAEPQAEAQPSDVDAYEALAQKLEERIKNSQSLANDPLSEYGVEAQPEYNRAPDVDDDDDSDESSYQKLKKENERLKAQMNDLSNRSQVERSLGKIQDSYPNAFEPTIKAKIRQGASPEQIEGVAKASHLDFERGFAKAAEEFKAELDSIRAGAKQQAEAEVQNAWGKPPTSPASVQGKQMTWKEFKVWSKGKTDAEQAAQMPFVDWGDNNPYGQQLKKQR